MNTPPAFRATFTSIRHSQGRKCWQLVMEVAQEQIDDALLVLGGMPKSDDPVWVAIARLNSAAPSADAGHVSSPGDSGSAGDASGEDVKPDAPPKPRRHFSELPRSQQAGMRCSEFMFQQWLFETYTKVKPHSLDDDTTKAAEMVRKLCACTSRAELDSDPQRAAIWDKLHARYRQETGQEAWQR